MVYVCVCIYGMLLSLKKKEIMPLEATTRMDLEIIILSEKVRKTNTCYHLYVESKK